MNTSAIRRVLLPSVAALFAACVEVMPLELPPRTLFEAESVAAESEVRPFVGLVLEESLGSSLAALEFEPGLSVVEVARGSPAERAGLRRGDRVLEAAGVELSGLDQWRALLAAHRPGDALPVAVERNAGLLEVTLEVAEQGGAGLGNATRFIERRRLRAVFETVAGGSAGVAPRARVVEFLAASPLPGAGLEVGDEVVALDGTPVAGARELCIAAAARAAGARVRLTVIEPGDAGAKRRSRDVHLALHEPPRALTRLAFLPLFDYEHEVAGDTTRFAIVDLWLFALYDYERNGETRRHRVLRLIVFESGAGELSEEPAAEPRSAGGLESSHAPGHSEPPGSPGNAP